jgi:GNAT superfamily N-acetyltransferase
MTPQETLRETLQHEYPKTVGLAKGGTVSLRPLRAGDETALLEFFRRIPAHERGRFFRDNVADPKVVTRWCEESGATRNLVLVALDGERIIADAALLPDRLNMKSHVAQMRLTVDPQFRGAGLGKRLVAELLDVAPLAGVAWVDTELYTNETPALKLVRAMGFRECGILPEHGRDMTGMTFDVMLFTRETANDLLSDTGGEG